MQLDPDGQGPSGGLGLGLSLVRRAAGVLGTPVAQIDAALSEVAVAFKAMTNDV